MVRLVDTLAGYSAVDRSKKLPKLAIGKNKLWGFNPNGYYFAKEVQKL